MGIGNVNNICLKRKKKRKWYKFQKLLKLIAKNARNINLGKFLNIRNQRNPLLPKEEEDMTENKLGMEVRLNLFSERKLRLPRKSLLNLSVQNASWLDVNQLKEPKPLFS